MGAFRLVMRASPRPPIPAVVVSTAAASAFAVLSLAPVSSAHFLVVGGLLAAAAFAAIRRIETQLLARAAWGLFVVVGVISILHDRSPMTLTLLVGAAGSLLLARDVGLDDDGGGAFRPRAHRTRILVATAVAFAFAPMLAVFSAAFAEVAVRMPDVAYWYPRYLVVRYSLLSIAFAASAVATFVGALALLRLRTLGLVLLVAGNAIAFATAVRGHAFVKTGFALLVAAVALLEAALLWPFLRGLVGKRA